MNKHVVAYIVISALLLFGMNAYIGSSQVYKVKTGKIDANYAALNEQIASGLPTHLIVGNSYVAESWVHDDPHFFEFTVNAMPIADIADFVESLPVDFDVETVVVGLGYNYATPVRRDASAFEKHITTNPVRRMWASIPLVRGRSVSTNIVRDDVKSLLATVTGKGKKQKQRQAAPDFDYTNADPTNTDEHAQKMAKSIRARFNEYVPFLSTVSQNLSTYVQRIKTAADERNVRLLMYTAPIHPELLAMLDAELLDEFRALVAATGVDYVDFNVAYPSLDTPEFADATHVSQAAGRDMITPRIVALIQSDLADANVRTASLTETATP